jgi:hypothetical protein
MKYKEFAPLSEEFTDFKNGHKVIFDIATMSILEGPYDRDNWNNDSAQMAGEEHGSNIAVASYHEGQWFVTNTGKQVELNGYHPNAHSMGF